MKLGGQVENATRKNCFNFGEDLNPDLEVFEGFPKSCVVDGCGRNLVDRMGSWQG